MSFSRDEKSTEQNYMQWIATFTMCMLNIQLGVGLGWESPNIARFSKNTSEIFLTLDEITWVSSSSDLSGVAGALLGPLLIQFFGPKTTSIITFLGFITTWAFIMTANSFYLLLIGRIFSGLSFFIGYMTFGIYLGEVSRPEIRGTLISVALNGLTPGTIISAYLETQFSRRINCSIYIIGCLVPIVFLIFVLPESPYFLVKSEKNTVKTKKSISVYFPNEDVDEKLINIKNFVTDQANSNKKLVDIIGSKKTRKLIFATLMITTLVSSIGMVNILRYFQLILERANSYVVDPQYALSYIGLSTLIVKLVTCNLIDKLGRKLLFVVSSIIVSLSLAVLGFHFFLLHLSFIMNGLGWVPIACLGIIEVFFGIGLQTSLYAILGELCPPSAKNLNNCLSYLCTSLLNFTVTKIYLPVSNKFGDEYMFWFHAAGAFLIIPTVIYLLPETKGKKLEDV